MRTLQVAKRSRRETVEQQLANLERWGIRLREGLDAGVLLREHGRRFFEATPYVRLLAVLGETDRTTGLPNSPDLCYLHAGSVRGSACYVRIVERLRDLSSGSLPLDDVEQETDEDERLVRLRVRVDTRVHEWAFHTHDQWLDPTLLTRVAQLQRARGPQKCYSYADLGPQGCLVGCFTAPQLYLLRNGTGLGWRWLG